MTTFDDIGITLNEHDTTHMLDVYALLRATFDSPHAPSVDFQLDSDWLLKSTLFSTVMLKHTIRSGSALSGIARYG